MPCISSMTSLFPAYLSNSARKRQSCTTAAINLSNGCGAIGATAARIKATAVSRLCHSGRMGVVLYCFEAGKTLVGSGEPLSERLASKPKTASAIAVNGRGHREGMLEVIRAKTAAPITPPWASAIA